MRGGNCWMGKRGEGGEGKGRGLFPMGARSYLTCG